LWLKGLRAFIETFFRCQECQSHFLQQLNAPAVALVVTKADAVMWMWETHNKVNERIAKVGHHPRNVLRVRLVFLSSDLTNSNQLVRQFRQHRPIVKSSCTWPPEVRSVSYNKAHSITSWGRRRAGC
jgi:hypothetical protein